MSFENLFGKSLDEWSEGIVAALFLHGIEPQLNMFDATTGPDICERWKQISSLPGAWATELCLEVLEGCHD